MWIFDDASPLEIGWTLYNLFGAGLCAGLCYDVVADARDRLLMEDEARRRATYLCLGIIGVLLGAMLTYATIGLVQMTQPSTDPDGMSPGAITAAIGFMLVATAKIILCGYWRSIRFRLRREGNDPATTLSKAVPS